MGFQSLGHDERPDKPASNMQKRGEGRGSPKIMNRPVSSLASGNAQVDKLVFSATAEEIEEVKARLFGLTKATVIVRSPKRDPVTGRCEYVEVPDSGIQLAASVKFLEFSIGKPRQTMEVQTGPNSAGRAQDLGHLLGKNPDLAASLLKMVKERIENAQAIPVQAVKSDSPSGKGESESPSPQR